MKRLISLILLASLYPVASTAQEAEPGGIYFTLDVGQTLEASSDRDLGTEAAEDGLDSVTSLSFGAVTETRTQRLSFELGTELRVNEDGLTGDSTIARLAYSRNSAGAELGVLLETQREDISLLRDVTDFISDDGEIELPDDFADLVGTGIRADTSFAASLTWGETAPIGYSVSVGQQMLRYEDASVALVDSDSASLGFGIRLNINEVTTGNLDLRYSQTDDVGSPTTQLTTLSGALTFARPLGDLTTRLGVAQDETDDTFWGASITREYTLPDSSISGTLGLVEDASGDARVTGRLAFSYPVPTGLIDLGAVHSLSAGGDRATTALSAGYLHELSPVSNMQFRFDFAQASDPDGSDVLAIGGLSAIYGISLTEVWDLNVGARVRARDDSGVRTRSSSVFVALERPFSWR